MKASIEETERRREKQQEYNDEHGITPETIKAVESPLAALLDGERVRTEGQGPAAAHARRGGVDPAGLANTIKRLKREMRDAAKKLDFERAAELRDGMRTWSRGRWRMAWRCERGDDRPRAERSDPSPLRGCTRHQQSTVCPCRKEDEQVAHAHGPVCIQVRFRVGRPEGRQQREKVAGADLSITIEVRGQFREADRERDALIAHREDLQFDAGIQVRPSVDHDVQMKTSSRLSRDRVHTHPPLLDRDLLGCRSHATHRPRSGSVPGCRSRWQTPESVPSRSA